jgi:hypothetical protein
MPHLRVLQVVATEDCGGNRTALDAHRQQVNASAIGAVVTGPLKFNMETPAKVAIRCASHRSTVGRYEPSLRVLGYERRVMSGRWRVPEFLREPQGKNILRGFGLESDRRPDEPV